MADKETKKNALAMLNETASKGFMELVQSRYAQEYADDALKLMKEFKKIEKAYTIYQKWMTEIEAGNLSVLDEYRKKRHRLEMEDGFEL